MQMHVTEAADPENNLHARFAQGSRIQKMLLNVASTSDDGERDPVSGHIFQRTCSDRHHAKETEFEHALTGDESWFCYEHPMIRLGLH
jgi:hypothetical protein